MVFRLLSNLPGFSQLRGDPREAAALKLYGVLVSQARNPAFYLKGGVPDSLEGRFEMIALHMFAVLRHLRKDGPSQAFAQNLFDVMFEDMDDSFREMGVGDTKVGKKVRGLAEDFYGCVGAYEDALTKDAPSALEETLSRNIYGLERSAHAPAMARYVTALDERLKGTPTEQIVRAELDFPPFRPGDDDE